MSTHSMTPSFYFRSFWKFQLLRRCSLSCFVDVCVIFCSQLTPLHALGGATPPPSSSQSPWCLVCVSLFSPCSLRLAAYTAALALDNLSSVATNSDTATATIDPAQDSPSSETTTLTCSLSTPANEPSDPSPGPLPAPAPTPESNAALPAPIISSSTIEAKMAPLVEQRGRAASEEQEEKTPPPPVTPERTRPQKSGTPIPPKRRHSPKLAALHAKGSPPLSPLAASSSTSSPSFETKKQAPSPPVSKPPTKPEAPAQAGFGPSKPEPESHPDPSERAHRVNKPGQQPDDDAPPPKTAEESPLVADVPSPLPITSLTSAPAPTNALPSHDFLAPLPDTYDLLTPEAGPKSADFELELTNGTESAPLIPEDLISLESPPCALPNGDGADLPLTGPVVEASETLAKTAPPVNDEYGSL